MNPKVSNVIPNNDYTLLITFSNGDKRVFEMKDYLNIGKFNELRDLNLFKTARVSIGTICWDNGLDLCPDTFFLQSKPI